MSEITTHRMGAFHTVHTDNANWIGLLVCPDRSQDVRLVGAGCGSVQEVDWDDTVRGLYRLGWELVEDEYGDALLDGYTHDGREVYGLVGRAGDVTRGVLDGCEPEDIYELEQRWARVRAVAQSSAVLV